MNQAKEYLNQIRTLDSKIQRRQQEIEELRTAAMSSGTQQLDEFKIRTDSPDPDPLATAVSRYVDMQKEVEEMILELTEMKHEVIGQISLLDDARYMEVLWKRYVDLKSFGEIAEEMHYTLRHVTNLHGRALQMFNEMFEFL